MLQSKETQRESRILRGFVPPLWNADFGQLAENVPGQYSFHMKSSIFWLGRAQEGPQEGKCTKRSPWKSILATRICCKKQGLDESPAQNPVFLHAFSCPCFQNPIFCMLFEKFYSPGGDPGGPWQDQTRPERLQKHRVLKTC